MSSTLAGQPMRLRRVYRAIREVYRASYCIHPHLMRLRRLDEARRTRMMRATPLHFSGSGTDSRTSNTRGWKLERTTRARLRRRIEESSDQRSRSVGAELSHLGGKPATSVTRECFYPTRSELSSLRMKITSALSGTFRPTPAVVPATHCVSATGSSRRRRRDRHEGRNRNKTTRRTESSHRP